MSSLTYAPIILKVKVDSKYVRTEQDGSYISTEKIEKYSKQYEACVKKCEYFIMSMNYRLKTSIPPENIEVYLCIGNEKDEPKLDYKYISLGKIKSINFLGTIDIMK